MDKHFLRTFLAIGLGTIFSCAVISPCPLRAQEPAANSSADAQAAVVDIETAEGHGTGILLNKSGRILTNAHVAASPLPLKCRVDVRVGGEMQTATFTRVSVVGFHPSLDLALIQIDPRESKGTLQPAKFARGHASAGLHGQVILNPSGGGEQADKSATPAQLDDMVRFPDTEPCLRISGPTINPGNTGAPFCDDAGRVLGIVLIKGIDRVSVAIAAPIDESLSGLGKFVPFVKRKADTETARQLVARGDEDARMGQQAATARGPESEDAKLHFYLASRCYHQAIVEDPSDARNFYYLGGMLRSIDKAEAAVPYLMKAIELEPWVRDQSDYYRELGMSLLAVPNKKEEARIVFEEGLAKFPREASKIWEDMAITAAKEKETYDAAYFAAVALRVPNRRTRTEVLQDIYNRHRAALAEADQQRLASAEAKIDDMLRQRQDESDRARKAGQRFIDRACEELLAKQTRGMFRGGAGAAADAASNSLAAAQGDNPAADQAAAADEINFAPGARAALPTAAQLAEAMKGVKEVYGDEAATAKTPDEKKALAEKVLKTARETDKEKDPAERYALLRMARDYATQACDVETAFAAVDEIVNTFEVDPLETRSAALAKIASSARAKDQHKALAAKGLALLRAALAKDNLPIARQLSATARSESQKGADKALSKEIAELSGEIDGISKSLDAVKPALATLKEKPNDADANLAVGKYHCFIKGDWKTGLPMLALGSDEALKDAATKELAGADSTDAQVALGNQWWELAEKQEGIARRRARARAAYWYDQVLPELSGLTKQKIERRVKQASAELVAAEPAGDKSGGAANGKTKKTDTVGGPGGVPFDDLPGKHSLLVGFDVTLGTWAEKPVPFIWSLQPVYSGKQGNFSTKVYGNRNTDKIHHILAKPGYAVAGMTVNAEHLLAGFKVKFMRIHGNALDPKDTYESDWIGGQWGKQDATLGGEGKPVVGCYGRSADGVDCFGLILSE